MQTLSRFIECINQIEKYIPKQASLNPKVSKVSVGWHLDHSLKVIISVFNALEASDPKTYKNNFSFLGKIFFTLGFFPRGKAKAPKYVQPPESIAPSELISQVEEAKTKIDIFNRLDPNAYFKHPLFGNINKSRVLRFLEMHTQHHLKIVKDIL